jgi:hypothetical protein
MLIIVFLILIILSCTPYVTNIGRTREDNEDRNAITNIGRTRKDNQDRKCNTNIGRTRQDN